MRNFYHNDDKVKHNNYMNPEYFTLAATDLKP